jgi:hypothetical protein
MNGRISSKAAGIYGWAALALVAIGFALIATGYWPGIMIDDARWQYQQSVDNAYEDWHPPVMAWIWRRLMFIQPGPAPMFVLQLALYWLGIGLAAWWAYRRQRPRLAVALALVGWIPAPLALTGTVTKDCLMSGALGCATGLLLVRDLAGSWRTRGAISAGAIAFTFFAAALRLNALVACLPLFLVALPRRLTSNWPRIAGSALVGALALLAIGPVIDRLLQAEDTDVSLSLIIFDLGGITEHSGVSQFPDLGVRDPVAVNHRCYDPVQWDSYSSWAKTPCPLGFVPFQNAKDENDLDPIAIWIHAVVNHPLAYAEHRLTHFNLSTWFLVPSGPEFTAWSQSVPNPWGYRVRSSAVIAAVTAVADAAARTPFGWPIFWIGVALAALAAALMTREPPLVIALAASSFLYGLSYLVFGVAVGMRYYFWTISAAGLAAVLLAGEIAQRRTRLTKPAIAIAAAIIIVPTALAILARLML